jgi:hypothetical protein
MKRSCSAERDRPTAREIVHLPGAVWLFVQQPQRLADEPVAQPGQPAGGIVRQILEVAARRVDENHLRQPFEHGITARPRVAGFHRRLFDDASDPVTRRARPAGAARALAPQSAG